MITLTTTTLQRNATKLFKQLQIQIQTTIALGNPTEEDVNGSMEKVLALDKAYPLPLLGAMLDKIPEKRDNGWSEELEMELREVVEMVRRKDAEDFERLGSMALKMNKSLGIAGPLLSGIAAVASALVGSGSLAGVTAVMAGSLAAAINALEHGGQVGMVFEMYRNCGGLFQLLEETIEAEVEEEDLERRQNGGLFEMKIALMLGRSVSQLRELTTRSASCRMEGNCNG
ncbi:unnamed protein product [Sphenostylis stenocarpa]|uniref:F-box protein n=1 Tax=Sphenostylis stenocarpa TaxID=92480 RepID=A0AA86SVW7_9FABA|nr:unnamed protein product [Sphenostylis stenocarpa]